MMHRAWCSIVEVPYRFSRSYVKFQGHTALKIVEFDPNWAFPDCISSLNSPMAIKCCTKLETAKERCPIIFQGHPSNFKVTRDKTPILTQIGRFRTIGRLQLSNPSDLPCFFRLATQSSITLTTSPGYEKVLNRPTTAAFPSRKTIRSLPGSLLKLTLRLHGHKCQVRPGDWACVAEQLFVEQQGGGIWQAV